jgi:hypothetical protein
MYADRLKADDLLSAKGQKTLNEVRRLVRSGENPIRIRGKRPVIGLHLQESRISNEEISSLLNDIGKSGERLAGDIGQTVSVITVHEKFERIIENAISILDLILMESRQLAPHTESGNRSNYLQHLEQNYTMHSERKIHSLITAQDGYSAVKPSPEKGNIAVQFINVRAETHQEFGDNVELF